MADLISEERLWLPGCVCQGRPREESFCLCEEAGARLSTHVALLLGWAIEVRKPFWDSSFHCHPSLSLPHPTVGHQGPFVKAGAAGLALGAVVSAIEPGKAPPGGEAEVLVPKSASPLRFSLGLSSPLGMDPFFP